MYENKTLTDRTRVVHSSGRATEASAVLNPPIVRASTILYDTVEAYANRRDQFYDGVMYGLYGTPTTQALAEAVSDLEQAAGTVIVGSGTGAIICALSAFVQAGDHILVADTSYGSTRKYCDQVLRNFGVSVTYFAPEDAGSLSALFTEKTRLVYMESPGSQTFELIDVEAVVKAARPAGIVTMIDNTWASPLMFKPISKGVDISIHSGSKYLSGHSDVMLGTLSTRTRAQFERLKDVAGLMGQMASPDDCYLVHRGIRTLDVRLQRHQKTAQRLMSWLSEREEVDRVLSPAWGKSPDHDLWLKDFSGGSGLFSVVFKPAFDDALVPMIEALKLFRMGSSWGGYESLVAPALPVPTRALPSPYDLSRVVRFHAGLEEVEDLISDLAQAFETA